jgi:hypothetical protein
MMLTFRDVLAVAIRPWLWATAVGAVFAFARRGWWRIPPFLPLPDPDVVAWRVTTAYGQSDMTLVEGDLVSYLQWRRRVR